MFKNILFPFISHIPRPSPKQMKHSHSHEYSPHYISIYRFPNFRSQPERNRIPGPKSGIPSQKVRSLCRSSLAMLADTNIGKQIPASHKTEATSQT